MKLFLIIMTVVLGLTGCSIRPIDYGDKAPSTIEPSEESPSATNTPSTIVRFYDYHGGSIGVMPFASIDDFSEIILEGDALMQILNIMPGQLINVVLDRTSMPPRSNHLVAVDEVAFDAEYLGLIDSSFAEFRVGNQIISLQFSAELRGNFPDFPPRTKLKITALQNPSSYMSNLILKSYSN